PSSCSSAGIKSGSRSTTKSMSLVARGSPCTELAREPPRKYAIPSRSKARATVRATSSGSMASDGIVRDSEVKSLGGVSAVEPDDARCPDLLRTGGRMAVANAGFSQGPDRHRESRGLAKTEGRRARAEKLVVTPHARGRGVLLHGPQRNAFGPRPL